jgi:TusA-related sulfurtransferase
MIFKRKYPTYSCILPSKDKEVFFRPFLVSDEKSLLLIKEEKNPRIIFKAILDLIEDCYKDITITDLTLQDMEYLFCNLRAKSVGEMVKISFTCPTTQENIHSSIDLSKINIVKGTKEKELKLDDTTKIIVKEPKISRIIQLSGDFDTKHFLKASIAKVYMDENVMNADDISEEDMSSLLSNLTISEYEKIKSFVNDLPKITAFVKYQTNDQVERTMKLEGILNFFTHA